VAGSLDVRMPVFAPAAWARRAQAADLRTVAELTAADANRQTALATADAFLAIIARRRVVETNERARDVARAHFELARQLQERGTGSRLNELRAQQELSIDEGLVEVARLALYRAQEALGVLLAADGPVDAADEPTFAVPADAASQVSGVSGAGGLAGAGVMRTDLSLFTARQQAAERAVRDTSKDYFPALDAIFQPQTSYPSPFFTPANSWRFLMQATIPVFDSGLRAARQLERQSTLDVSRATLVGALTSVSSEVRTARESVASAERSLSSAQAGAGQAQEVVNIVNVSFRAGAATNIEVIDAERRARDADTAVAVAEDALRRARLDLLNALGRFP
jgi:outer membrane protein TolC